MPDKLWREGAAIEINIRVEIHRPLLPPALEALPLLLKGLGGVWDRYPVPHLDSILVYPKTEIPSVINAIIAEFTGIGDGYQAPDGFSLGTALPIEDDGELRCFIFIAQEAIEGLTPERHRPFNTVSTVVEEFLHVWLYGVAWERTGRIQPPPDPDRPCDQDLETILGRAFDEYVVGRHKALLFDELPLIDHEGGWATARISYGGDLTGAVRRCGRELRERVLGVALGRESVADAWPLVLETLYRGLLDPLSRNAAPLDAYDDMEDRRYEPDGAFYRRAAEPFGGVLLTQMRRAFANPAVTEDARKESLRALKTLLATIGVTFRRKDGGCYVECASDSFAVPGTVDAA